MERMIYQVDATREKILAAAETLFAAKGFFDVKMSDLADAVGLSRNSLYRYYLDKNDLALAILERILSQTGDVLVPEGGDGSKLPPPIIQLERFLRHLLFGEAARIHGRFLAEFDAYFVGERSGQAFRSRMNAITPLQVFDRLEDVVRQGVADGSLRPDLHPRRTALAVTNAIRALQQRVLLRFEDLKVSPDDDPNNMVEDTLQLLLNGMKNPQGECL